MTPQQKRDFHRDGFIVFRDILSAEVVNRAIQTFYGQLSPVWHTSMTALRQQDNPAVDEHHERWQSATRTAMRTGVDPSIMDLVDPENALMKAIRNAIGGPIRELRGAQLATIFPSLPTNHVNEAGYPSLEVPFYGWHGHLDGLWNGSAPVHQRLDRPMNRRELDAWSRNTARNGVRRTYPGTNANINNFTALLGIPLSDQSEEGTGNLGLLKGAHHHMERFFQKQRDLGGPLGPDGPGWDRVDSSAPNRSGLRHYPDDVREAFKKDAAHTADGRLWPKPELIRVKPGDAVLALHAIPHCSTRLEFGGPRLYAYFRLVSAARTADQIPVYPDALCDCWLEWQGMQETVRESRVA